jgi:hypothetical protein
MTREFAEWLKFYRIAKARGLSHTAASEWADRSSAVMAMGAKLDEFSLECDPAEGPHQSV